MSKLFGKGHFMFDVKHLLAIIEWFYFKLFLIIWSASKFFYLMRQVFNFTYAFFAKS